MTRHLKTVLALLRMLRWIAVTVGLGALGVITAAAALWRMRRLLATSLRCARGHRVELYGTFRCSRCRAAREGRAFDPCPVCAARPTHLDCDRCGLPVMP